MEITKGDRLNSGKLKWSLVSWKALGLMVEVLEYGAKKYAPHNWRKGLSWTETADSLQRHLNAFIDESQDLDEESKLSHVGHILCNAMYLAYMYLFRKDLDDRYKDPNFDVNKTNLVNNEDNISRIQPTGVSDSRS